MSAIRNERPLPLPAGRDALALLVALAVVAITLLLHRQAIAGFNLRDADDAMRLAQVRDLIAGQGWFDIRQYRVDPAAGGGLMHWSRFIDIQIAALIALLKPLLGAATAERWVIAVYPPLLLFPLFLLFGRIFARLGGRRLVAPGLLLAATGVTFLHYFAPLRIDHHNWQLLLSVAMLWLALGPPGFRRGLAAALVITVHSEISLEGLAYLAIFGGIFGLEWLRDPRAEPRLAGYAAGLLIFPLLWLGVFRGWQAMTAVSCDSFSLPYLAGVTATAAIVSGGLRAPAAWAAAWPWRLAGLMLAGGVGAGVFVSLGQSCFAGPFAELEPLVRTHWYVLVSEGRPLWQLAPNFAAVSLAPTMVGLAAAFWAWRRARGGPLAADWTQAGLACLGAALVSVMVMRTGAVAHAFLLPAFAVLALAIWDWSRSRRTALGRVGAAAAILLASPSVAALIAAKAVDRHAPPPRAAAIGGAGVCPTPPMLSALAAAAPVRLFAPIDIGPALLVRTPHSVVATGHHRNHAAMNRVIAAFVAAPDQSEAIVRGEGAAYLVFCTPVDEMQGFARANPHGLAARLIRGEPVAWLVRDPALSAGVFHVYRIAAAPKSTAPAKILPVH